MRKRPTHESGWTQVRCPWVHNHTDQADNGAAVAEPSAENNFVGGFKCQHGHCSDKSYADVVEIAVEMIGEVLEAANETSSGESPTKESL